MPSFISEDQTERALLQKLQPCPGRRLLPRARVRPDEILRAGDIFKQAATFGEYAGRLLAQDELRTPRVLVREWHKATPSKRRVERLAEEILHETLPGSHDRAWFKTKCDEVFGLGPEYASQGRKWAA